jgi:predicted DNA-binding transcriptional regulator AlpA
MQRFFRVRELASTPEHSGRYPISRATLWRWVKRGEFPSPVRLSRGVTAWPVDIIEAWESQRKTVAESHNREDKTATAQSHNSNP